MYFTNEKKNLIFVSFKYSDLNDPIGLSHFMVSGLGGLHLSSLQFFLMDKIMTYKKENEKMK